MKRIILYICVFILPLTYAYCQHEITKDVVIKYLGGVNQPWRTMVSMENYGINRNLHKWRVFVASYEGYSGVSSNGFEIWEYPDKVNPSSPNGIRLVIETCRDKTTKPVTIGPRGSLNIGYENTFKATDVNMLSVNGNVGIGTLNTNGYKLSVVGTIRANEIIVNTSGADFVFEDEYELPTLEEVANHIKEKKHLPGIPSAKEVQENGMGLAEMNTKLLQKIEELTLYTLHQQELIENQSKLMEDMREEMKEMEYKINQR